MGDFTDSGVLVRLAYQAMQDLGIDAAVVLQRIGLKHEQLDEKDLRTPHSAQNLFWTVIEEVSNDPDIGLHLGEKIPVFKGQVLEYLFLSSETFGEGLKRALSYQRLLSDAVNATLEEDEIGLYVGNISFTGGFRHLTECVVIAVLKFFDYVTEGAFQPLEIHFEHAMGDNPQEYKRVFPCPVKFEQAGNRIYFTADSLNVASSHAEPELLKLHEQLANEHVAKLEKQDFIAKVNRLIGELLESGNANLETVAERLQIKPRSLRTKLAEVDTNFNQLLADYRCNLAKKLLARTDESIDEIVYLTGFSEPSTFYRAFKRWVGQTPVEYRKAKQK
ncbi:MAG: AraC family transcriptional regulator [Pseudomonadales bacterium]|jgi:AraC-like DNA-binding protein|uniref:AraC family transcriptional regulator n=1 Tax=unclassified Ketobacter TaxID=2639109 RepID=UPI000C3C03E3|nr:MULTISPECIES: AraC family transcriptional regulator [unclassified Ketobacter]MAQ23868.1 AraC family transcriptional regulator [Pseudomonadales bacterium]MEC8811425.1 AraC family transcriptional regulator [Pseudomonadota bacterium]TNC85341.1 MAG: AraC family transcriptional regulator [Alcanivorax sp.]HAG93189.1 AraC family transcriptional regulator [Gammaproteobacteria bacterium]MBI26147.1 AraC family transcriptional regulator [Pseudomonadales bacterium]|tara:strand:- start:7461 stop:8459 length:999 start_codon:yes stop_codon:yes gene_type:complete